MSIGLSSANRIAAHLLVANHERAEVQRAQHDEKQANYARGIFHELEKISLSA